MAVGATWNAPGARRAGSRRRNAQRQLSDTTDAASPPPPSKRRSPPRSRAGRPAAAPLRRVDRSPGSARAADGVPPPRRRSNSATDRHRARQADRRRPGGDPGGATPRPLVSASERLPGRPVSRGTLRRSRGCARDARNVDEAPRRRGETLAAGRAPTRASRHLIGAAKRRPAARRPSAAARTAANRR